MTGLLGGLWGRVAAAAGVLAAAALALMGFARGKRREGREAARTEAAERVLEHVGKAKDARDRVDGADGDAVDRLRDKWTRPGD